MRKLAIITVTILSLLASLGMTFVGSPSASALSGSSFQAGRIMDDSVFFNPHGMTGQDIQNFLSAKVPSCDTWGTKPRGGTTRAAYGTSVGNPPPYTCLKDYVQTTSNKSADGLCNGHTAGTKSSAQIIYEVAHSCGVSPKVLLVLLEKEQSLVTDDWPWSIQYRSATGYGCPDTAPCDAEYYGFFNQVYAAARQYKRYARDAHLFNYRSGRNNYIQYNPNAGCGGSNVFIQNQATAGLYNYTPYQPNAAALNNLYGTGDGCSAYGNRNFWRLYNDWFGSTFGLPYVWSYVTQYAYTDASKTTPVNLNNATRGQRVYLGVQAKNTGNATWTNNGANPVRLGTSNPLDRNSVFCDASWVSCARPANLKESSVAPGETGTFEFWYNIPAGGGSFTEYFSLLAEGYTWMNDLGLYFTTYAQPPTYTWQYEGQFAYTDSTKAAGVDLTRLSPGQRVYLSYRARNTGNVTWTNSGSNPVRTGTSNPLQRNSAFCDTTWLSCNRPANLLESSVAPGEIGTFEFWYKAPGGLGQYREYFRPLAEGIAWMNDPGLYYFTQVTFPAPAPGTPAVLHNNQVLSVNQSLASTDGRYQLILQGDGNLVLYSQFRPIWSSGTPGTSSNRLVMQGDGNLVLYDAHNQPRWHSRTAGRGPSSLVLQGDGNLVIYTASNSPSWHTGTVGRQ